MSVISLSAAPATQELVTDTFMDLLDSFRFDRVEKVMKTLEWKWHCSPAGRSYPNPVTPSIYEMKDQCWSLFNSCMKSIAEDPDQKDVYWSGGGFSVRVNWETRAVKIVFEAEYASNIP